MQKTFRNVEELISRLYQERKLIKEMFNSRKKLEFRLEDARHFVNSDKNLRILEEYGVVRCEGDILELDELYLKFLEEILQVNEEISQASVADQINVLRENIEYYLADRNNPERQQRYLTKVKRSLRTIAQMARRNVTDLKRNIDDTYKNEPNYTTKRTKLERFLSQISDIASLVKDTERFLDDEHSAFSDFSPDEHLKAIVIDVRTDLKETFHGLIALQRVIRDYLHQIEEQDRIVRKIRKLKYLKDQLIWESATDVKDILDRTDHLWMEPQMQMRLKPSLSYLESDDALQLIVETRDTLRKKVIAKPAEKFRITKEMMEQEPVVADFIYTDSVAAAFFASGRDLFNFVISHNYETPLSIEQKVEIYSEIIQNHVSELCFSDQWHEYRDISYPLIYPSKH